MFDPTRFVIESNAIEGYAGLHFQETVYFKQHMVAYEYLLENNINQKHILVAHGILTSGLLEPEESGDYRKVNVRIGNHIACHHVEVPNRMLGFMKEVKKAKTEDDCWNCHYMFETIHPFVDGNGRIGRCILNAMLELLGHEQVVIESETKRDYYGAIIKWRMMEHEN